jgi:O-methyltransferase
MFPVSFITDNDNESRPLERLVGSFVSRIPRLKHLQLVKQTAPTTEQREQGQIWPKYADTMIGLKRLDNLQFCLETVIREAIEGDFIETGVWRGGACIFMRGVPGCLCR